MVIFFPLVLSSFARRSLVRPLRFPVSPSAIFFAIVAIVIYAIKRHPLWSRTHIGIKVFKLVPALANGYAASSIVFISRIFLISASRQHRKPHSIDRLETHTMLELFGPISFGRYFLTKTPARSSFPVFQSGSSHDNFVSTIAMAQPSRRLTGSVLFARDDDKAAKSISNGDSGPVHSSMLTFNLRSVKWQPVS